MRATAFEFRFRFVIMVLLAVAGFMAPLGRFFGSSYHGETWGLLISQLNRSGWLTFNQAFVIVNVTVVLIAAAGAFLRVWGTAYLGAATMRDPEILAGSVVASGPYRHVRNPLYTGGLLLSIPVAILMPPINALIFLVLLTLFLLRLIGGEEAHLTASLGEDYVAYRRSVPGFIPSLRSRTPASSAKPHWLQAVVAEAYGIGIALCFAIFSWNYNAQLLVRCVLICLGASILLRGAIPRRDTQPAA